MTPRRLILAGLFLLVAACTRDDPVPDRLLIPAPRECPEPIVRANSAEPSETGDVLRGHVPTRLPDGFGLAGAWERGDGAQGAASWTDATCRLIWITLRAADDPIPQGPKLGDWTVVEDVPGECGNAVLGDARCLRYQTEVDGMRVDVFMMGVDRDEGDGIVLSISR